MRTEHPFIKLPLSFDAGQLAKEIRQFDETHWRPHPQGFEGNSSMVLVSHEGAENDDLSGVMKPAERLDRMPYIRQVMASFSTVIGRSRLMRLAPGATVDPHTDSHYFWRNHLRIHIPIITGPKVTFYCGTSEVNMAAGESWTFNNWLPHSVINGSEQSRIHLVIDTVGSSALWRMIDGRQGQGQTVAFEQADAPALQFESYQGAPVLTSAEIGNDIMPLIDEVIELDSKTASLKKQIHERTQDFLRDWQCHWSQHGPSISGVAGYKNLLEQFRAYVFKLPDQLRLISNKEPFKQAVMFTLDAALTPERIAETPSHQTAPIMRPNFDRPVFIVAAPRSGSTMLFETLAVNREFWTIGDESHKHFARIASLRPNGENPSNRLTDKHVTTDIKETLLNSFTSELINANGKPYADLTALSRPAEIRFLEKTPKNALRIPFLLKVFPDAKFIFLFRDAKQNISSLMETWRSQDWVTYPKLPGWPANKPWSHLLVPGWQDYTNASLAEIIAHQWRTTNQTIIDDLAALPRERWCTVEYDDFLNNTATELRRLCLFAQIIHGPRMHQIASRPLKPSKYTQTAPKTDKWKKNADEMAPVLPTTDQLMAEMRRLVQEEISGIRR